MAANPCLSIGNKYSYFFPGPVNTLGQHYLPSHNHTDHTIRDHGLEVVVMGLGETWVTVSPSGAAAWSPNILSYYPDIEAYWNYDDGSSRNGVISSVSLGTNGNFFIKGDKDTQAVLNQDIIDEAFAPLTPRYKDNVTVCALGKDGTWIMGFDDGTSSFCLKGRYGGLQQWLQSHVAVGHNIKCAALSLTDESFIVMMEDGTANAWNADPEYDTAWKQWCTDNFGTSWS